MILAGGGTLISNTTQQQMPSVIFKLCLTFSCLKHQICKVFKNKGYRRNNFGIINYVCLFEIIAIFHFGFMDRILVMNCTNF